MIALSWLWRELRTAGDANDEAVLCTASKTYAVKDVETTNLVLLVQGEGASIDGEGPVAGEGRGPLSPQPRNQAAAASPGVQPTPPGALVGLDTQLRKADAAAANPPVVVTARVGAHLELMPVAPRLAALDALLAERPYGADGGNEEGEAEAAAGASSPVPEAMDVDGSVGWSGVGRSAGLYGWQELLERVQASDEELRAALAQRHALLLDGCWRAVDPSYLGTVLELVLLTAVEEDWELNAIPGAAAAVALQQHGYDPRLTLHCLSVFGRPLGVGSTSVDAAGASAAGIATAAPEQQTAAAAPAATYELDEAAVCRHFAKQLLAEQQEWELGAFLDAWASRVPEGMSPDLEMLRGEVLLPAGGCRLRRFPLSELPTGAEPRFAALFAAQPRWEWAELEPYVEGLQQPGQTAEALLLKYARASQAKPSDPITYSAR
eukprot:scaffold8.g1625.t1